MMVFITDIEPLRDSNEYDRGYSLLSEYRKEKAARIKNPDSRMQSVAAGLLLNYAVGKWIETKKHDEETKNVPLQYIDFYSVLNANNSSYNYEIICDVHGKPKFFSHPEIFLNISHSGKYVACAVSDRPVGIDIEGGRKASISLAERFFDKSEADWIKEQDTDERFFRIWTLKEAYGKATSLGVLDILSKIVYKIDKNTVSAYECGTLKNITIVEYTYEGYRLSVIQL